MNLGLTVTTPEPPLCSTVRASASMPMRVLYSFPHRIGAGRIDYTAWQQVFGASAAGARVTLYTGGVTRALPQEVKTHTTLSYGRLRIPVRIVGTKLACAIHDWRVANALRRNHTQVDVVHTWPMGARRTLEMAKRCGIPSLLERPNAHTRYAYEVVERECRKLAVTMPRRHEHAFKADWLRIEEAEYALADWLLCPSDFVARTFLDSGFPAERLLRHQYGFDPKVYYPEPCRDPRRPFTMLFAGGCAPRKGLHYALQAWLASPASSGGKFRIAGEFIPQYAERLAPMLSHPSIELLGYRRNLPELMRLSDVFILPSVEEGSALVTSEARAAGCVLIVSMAAGAICRNGVDSLLHNVGDVGAIESHISALYSSPELLHRMRSTSLQTVAQLSWSQAGQKLFEIYQQASRYGAVRRK